jgi:hypothetical protein
MMDDISAMAMIDAVDNARIELYKQHCMNADDPSYAVSQLAGQFIHQACICLNALYSGNQKMIFAHIMMLIVTLSDEVESNTTPVLIE